MSHLVLYFLWDGGSTPVERERGGEYSLRPKRPNLEGDVTPPSYNNKFGHPEPLYWEGSYPIIENRSSDFERLTQEFYILGIHVY